MLTGLSDWRSMLTGHRKLTMLGNPDPRAFQIAVLTTLGATSAAVHDFGTSFSQLSVSVAAAVLAQAILSHVHRIRFDPWSPAITGLSLAILIRSTNPSIWVAAPMLGIAGKFLLRQNGKQLFNPACLAIVLVTGLSSQAWVSPGQWGSATWFAALVAGAGAVVLTRAARWDTAASFSSIYAVLLVCRAWLLGDPWTIPAHQLQSGSLLIFTAFMVTDPRSTPNARLGRVLFAAAVAVLGYAFQFHLQFRPGLFYALAACAPLTPLLDCLLPAARFQWSGPKTPSGKEALS